MESSSHSNPTLELFTHSPTHSDIQVETTAPSFVSFTAPDPSPCLCREFECQKERDGNGVDNETDKEASGNVELSEDTHGQLWAKFDKLYRGLSDPGFETRPENIQEANLTDMGAAPGNVENSLRVPVSQPDNENVIAIAEKWSAKFGPHRQGTLSAKWMA